MCAAPNTYVARGEVRKARGNSAQTKGHPETLGPEAARALIAHATYYRWRNEYGGLKSDQVKRLKDLETENARLRKAISDLTLDKLILQEAARGNY